LELRNLLHFPISEHSVHAAFGAENHASADKESAYELHKSHFTSLHIHLLQNRALKSSGFGDSDMT